MTDVKLLNLDELAIIERVVQFGGTQYPVAEQTVDQMISRMQSTKNGGKDLNDPAEFLANMRQTVQDILPSMPKKVVGSLSLEKMIRVVEFLNDKELNEAAGEMAATVTKESDEKGEPEKKS
jgi:uncharacterized protein YaaN involved in tellurite resistance